MRCRTCGLPVVSIGGEFAHRATLLELLSKPDPLHRVKVREREPLVPAGFEPRPLPEDTPPH